MHTSQISLLLSLFTLNTAFAAVIPVGPLESHTSIASALGAASAGDTLTLAAGNYEESVVIDKPIVISGPNASISAERGTASRIPEALIRGGFRILNTASGTSLVGLSVEQGHDDGSQFTGIDVEAEDIHLENLVLTNIGTLPGSLATSCSIRIRNGAVRTTISGSSIQSSLNGIFVESASGLTLTRNHFENQLGTAVEIASAGSNSSIKENRFLGNNSAFISSGPTALDLSENYWNTSNQPPATGGLNNISGPLGVSPWFADFELQELVHGILADETILAGETVSVDQLTIADGVTYTVEGGRLEVSQIEMNPGSTLRIVDGELVLDQPQSGEHTIRGTFEVTHSLCSIEILGDTEFSGSMLALVSDIQIADGVDLSVSGSLNLDGCKLFCDGNFNLSITTGATLVMRRCHVDNANVFVVSDNVLLKDNHFQDCSVTILGPVTTAKVYHNVFQDLDDLNIFSGTTVQTTEEGWGNVETIPDARNRLALDWLPSALSGRTLDSNGNMFVQPGDMVQLAFQSGGFTEPVQAMEALLAYHTDYLSNPSFTTQSPWENELYFSHTPLSVFGKIDSAVGFGFNHESPEGTLNDHSIGTLQFLANSKKGKTLAFFREHDSLMDSPFINTRLTTWVNNAPDYLSSPYTQNTGILTIDGTPPTISTPIPPVTQNLGSSDIDLTLANEYARMGTIDISFTAFDNLAGLNPTSVSAILDGDTQLPANLISTTKVLVGSEIHTQHSLQILVDSTTPDGIYDVVATVADRSGNTTNLSLGTIEIARQILTVDVTGQDWVADPITRHVDFTFTNSTGIVLERRTVPMNINNQTGTAILAGAPLDSTFISAKTAWTLRRKLPCSFDALGDGTVSFSGSAQLPGGDLDGNNIITLGDYNILNSNNLDTDPIADIDGSSVVNLRDYNILRSNYFSSGDPE